MRIYCHWQLSSQNGSCQKCHYSNFAKLKPTCHPSFAWPVTKHLGGDGWDRVISNRREENKGWKEMKTDGEGGAAQALVGSREETIGNLSPWGENLRPGDIIRIISTLLFLSSGELQNAFTEINEVFLVTEYHYFGFTGGLMPKVIKWVIDGVTHIIQESYSTKPRAWTRAVVKSLQKGKKKSIYLWQFLEFCTWYCFIYKMHRVSFLLSL